MAQQGTVWARGKVTNSTLDGPVDVVVARGLATVEGGNRLQTLNLYLPVTSDNEGLVGQPVTTLPGVSGGGGGKPRVQVHVHGGAWRDPMTDAHSIEAAVAHAFAGYGAGSPIDAIASINYTLTQFPLHPVAPYDAIKDEPKDPAREAVHPQHVHDVYRGLATLKRLGLADGAFVFTGHSAGACLVMQTSLMAPSHYGLDGDDEIPTPAAAIGLNGLYDLPALVYGLGLSHELTGHDYRIMLVNAFGPGEHRWAEASPAHFDSSAIAGRVQQGKAPGLVLIDQSVDDQLVPVNQRERLEAVLSRVQGLDLMVGHRCTGKHSEPWLKGDMIWNSVKDALARLAA